MPIGAVEPERAQGISGVVVVSYWGNIRPGLEEVRARGKQWLGEAQWMETEPTVCCGRGCMGARFAPRGGPWVTGVSPPSTTALFLLASESLMLTAEGGWAAVTLLQLTRAWPVGRQIPQWKWSVPCRTWQWRRVARLNSSASTHGPCRPRGRRTSRRCALMGAVSS